MNENIIIQKTSVEEIPILFVRQDNAERKEAIFVLHKLLCDKTSELPLAYELAKEGYFVIIMDIMGHGERNTLKEHKYDFQNMFYDVRKTVEDIGKVLQYIRDSGEKKISLNHTGVVGTSFGASIALIAGYMLKEISYVACLIGTCNLRYIIENRTLCVFRPFSLSKNVIDYDKVIDEMEELDCLKNYNSDNLKPMLFLDGKIDMTIPYKEKTEFYRELESIFLKAGRKEDITYQFYSNTGHKLNDDMIHTLLVWLRQLKRNVSAERKFEKD